MPRIIETGNSNLETNVYKLKQKYPKNYTDNTFVGGMARIIETDK